MSNTKQRYDSFCRATYVPLYSKPWWMDAVCGEDTWDVWLYDQGGNTAAALPYCIKECDRGRYITKIPLTQNNGIIFKHSDNAGAIAQSKLEEKIIDSACSFIERLNLTVFEQQFSPSFLNWMPFYWHGFSAMPRYTYAIEDTCDLEKVWSNISSKQRSCIKKGIRNSAKTIDLDPSVFYDEHEKIFTKQELKCPFSKELWMRLYEASKRHNCGRALGVIDDEGNVSSLLFLVWDERRVYHLLGGGVPPFQTMDTYSALTWEGIKLAHKKGRVYDFEGSMIKRIAKSFREYGGTPQIYFRIRKEFCVNVVHHEAEVLGSTARNEA